MNFVETNLAGAFIVEPEPSIVLDKLFVHLVKSFVYHSLLEAVASEQSARRVAMQNATDAAEEMIEDLTLTFNQARQSGITQEIAEISIKLAAHDLSIFFTSLFTTIWFLPPISNLRFVNFLKQINYEVIL